MIGIDLDLHLGICKEVMKECLQFLPVDIDAFPCFFNDDRGAKICRFVFCISDSLLNSLRCVSDLIQSSIVLFDKIFI